MGALVGEYYAGFSSATRSECHLVLVFSGCMPQSSPTHSYTPPPRAPPPSRFFAQEGFVTFVSFILFGSVPMIVYLSMFFAGFEDVWITFGSAAAATVATLFTLGAAQAAITKQNIWLAGLMMMVNGSLAAAAAYLLSWGLLQAIGNGQSTSCLPSR